jgi:hypothetical protein
MPRVTSVQETRAKQRVLAIGRAKASPVDNVAIEARSNRRFICGLNSGAAGVEFTNGKRPGVRLRKARE